MPGRLIAVVVALFVVVAAPAHAITGGTPATEAYPWMASLQVDEQHICGASLVRPDTVLTAAHCVQSERVQGLSVVLGRTTLSGDGGERIAAKSVEVNEDYATDPNGGHDIALVRLEHASNAATLDLIAPAQAELWTPGSAARVIGWGASVFAVGPGTDDLMQADIDVISDADCDGSYNGLVNYGFDPTTMVCAGKQIIGLEDACQGDSGGPLVVNTGGGWAQIGTVSFGLGCGFPLFYGVYGRVGGDVLREWLRTHLGSEPEPATPQPSSSTATLRVKRARRSGRELLVRVVASARVTAVKAVLRHGGAVVGRGGLPRIRRSATIVLQLTDGAPRRARLRITATDAGGHPVRVRRPVTLYG